MQIPDDGCSAPNFEYQIAADSLTVAGLDVRHITDAISDQGLIIILQTLMCRLKIFGHCFAIRADDIEPNELQVSQTSSPKA